MNELFIVLRFSDGDVRYLFFTDVNYAVRWASIYKPDIPYEMHCYASEEDYFKELDYV